MKVKTKRGISMAVSMLMAGSMMACGTGEAVSSGDTEQSAALVTENAEGIAVTVEGEVYGSAKVDFNEKENYPFTTIKKYIDEDLSVEGTQVSYEEGVQLILESDDAIDDAKIDLSNAEVTLQDGDGYLVSDLIFSGNQFADRATVEDGVITYTLQEGDLEWNQYDYPVEEGGVEWSCQGGDGNGHYIFNMSVSGITYDGEPVADVDFRTEVYIYGRMFDSLHSPNGASESTWGVGMFDNAMLTGFDGLPDAEEKAYTGTEESGDTPVFSWVYGNEENEKPVFCDYTTDDLYILWPEDVDASALSAQDVTLTLKSQYGDELVLEENTGTEILEENGMEIPNGDYKVYSEENQTQISINYVNWAMTPVYTTLEVSVKSSKVDGYNEDLTEEYEIASVYAYSYQMGGGLDLEGKTVTTVAINGIADIEEKDVSEIIDTSKAEYYFSYGESQQGPGGNEDGEEDSKALYLVEESDGTYRVTTDKEEATVYAYGDEKNLANAQVNGHTLFVTNVAGVDVEYEGETYHFEANISAGQLVKNPAEIGEAAPGYAFSDSMMTWMAHQNWAYLYFNNEGWIEE